MITNYFKIVWRNLWKNKIFSLINILGLSIGISCCTIIGIYVLHELSYDKFFPNSDRVYRVFQVQEQAGELYQVASTPAALPEALKENYAEIEEVTFFAQIFNKRLFRYQDKHFEEGNGFNVDSSFFKFFNFHIVRGSLEDFFTSPNTILLTKTMAEKYFGKEDPIGKVININRNQDFVVAAVIEDPPGNSHLKFNFLLPMEQIRSYRDFTSWGNNWVYTYILLKKGTDVHAFESKIRNVLIDNIGIPEWQPKLYLQALKNIHLYSSFDFNTDFADIGSLKTIYLFGAIGLIILLISCINFINLTTAKAFRRNKETGIRKVVGANRSQLILQFMAEALLYVFLSTVLAILFAKLLFPYFFSLSGVPLGFELLAVKNLSGLLLAILLTTGMLIGIYPALLLSSTRAITISGKGLSPVKRNKKHQFSSQKTLVISQFSLSVVLIVCAIIIRQQMHFVLNRDPGFDKDQIVYTPMKGELQNETRFQSFKNELLQQASIEEVTRSNGLPINHEGSFEGVEWEGMPSNHQDFLMSYFDTDEGFVNTFGLKVLEGRNFLPRSRNDISTYYLVNETAINKMQLQDPVGKRLEDGIIVGVINDFNFQSAYKQIDPMILRSEQGTMKNRYVSVRIAAGNITDGVNTFERICKQFNPDYPIEYYFLDDSIATLYNKQIRSGKLINLFAALAIFISCLGLFGLASFITTSRIKEIGIRKVNGAKISEILTMLNKDFIKWVVIAFVVATPIAYYAMNKWLENFAYKTNLSWWIFALAGAFALGIALLTVSWQSWRAATRNPVEALRYE
ncbi:FtsX-like permease family protein [Maribellus comscasis]|uniref:FtsX-like permease family protein n=1 Tax=Maribellus comscasis TaxID=2681766 RepID=A0A6I6JUC3_9BACT|nr:ABC transporter permease [Maribellus comscasis]QGY44648.1 FtsX-like permease family protein [Maribellus comscasis]